MAEGSMSNLFLNKAQYSLLNICVGQNIFISCLCSIPRHPSAGHSFMNVSVSLTG